MCDHTITAVVGQIMFCNKRINELTKQEAELLQNREAANWRLCDEMFRGEACIGPTVRDWQRGIGITQNGGRLGNHFIPPRPRAGDPNQVFGLNKWITTTSSKTPGWEWMHETDVEAFQTDLKLGQSKIQGSFVQENTEGTQMGTYMGVAKFTIDAKTNAPRGTYEGTWEITGGTGRFASVRGHGVDNAKFDGDTFFDNWSGAVTGLEKPLTQ